jgi:hypothetical protein
MAWYLIKPEICLHGAVEQWDKFTFYFHLCYKFPKLLMLYHMLFPPQEGRVVLKLDLFNIES